MMRYVCVSAVLLLSFAFFLPAIAQDRADSAGNQIREARALTATGNPTAIALWDQLLVDPAISRLADWPDALCDAAEAYARAGKADLALGLLEKAKSLGNCVTKERLQQDGFKGVQQDPRYAALIVHLDKTAARWADNPAVATPYRSHLSEAEKVAGVSKLWSEAQFSFAFFHRLGNMDWDRLYVETLAQALAAQDTDAYYKVLMKFVAELRDGHSRVFLPPQAYPRLMASPGVQTALIENRVVIVGGTALPSRVHIGDELLRIDGVDVKAYARRIVEPYIFGYSTQDRDVQIYEQGLLRGPVGKSVRLNVRRVDGQTYTVVVPRREPHCTEILCLMLGEYRGATFSMRGQVAYLKVTAFLDDTAARQLRTHMSKVSQATGLIIDLRENGGGNSSSAYSLLALLLDRPVMDSRWRTPAYLPGLRAQGAVPGWALYAPDTIRPNPAFHISVPVVVLIGAHTYSAAEDFVVLFDTAGRGRLVGQVTGGSTGTPLIFGLPGGGHASICTKEDAYADGRTFLGTGITPDVLVPLTLADFRAGRDAALEKAEMLLLAP